MADGLNDARAMRIAEVMNDFRTIQHRISQSNAPPPQGQANAVGYVLLAQCRTEATGLLASPPPNIGMPASNDEQTKRSLQRVLLDASARRFRAHRIYLRATSAMRWAQRRQQVLRGGPPSPQHTQALNQIDAQLTQELALVSDSRVYNELRTKDQTAGYWLGEMADINTLLAYARTH